MNLETMHDRPPRKKRRVFLWVFLAAQVLFLIWLITGLTAGNSGGCNGLDAKDCAAASDIGHGAAVAVQLVTWCVFDVIVGGGYGIYRLAKRREH